MSQYWILDEQRKPKPVTDVIEWATWFEHGERKIKQSDIGGVHVSTVFIGIDHQFGNGPPLLYETMIFGGPRDESQARASTEAEALDQHEEACRLAREKAEIKRP
jgi:hypothetical protein